jgi:squalene-hopene/tetraprenyl-beta-curcumene cyclase
MALIAVGAKRYHAPIRAGVDYLLATQRPDGTWDEAAYTGTGFPGYGVGARVDLGKMRDHLAQGTELGRGFMINYNLYRHYFPLMALGRARELLDRAGVARAAD